MPSPDPDHDASESAGPAFPPPGSPGEHDAAGGPVKSFVEHLEDLRWVLIKCVVAVGLGMVVCLAAGGSLVKFLQRPLDIAQERLRSRNPTLLIGVGSNLLWQVRLPTNQLAGLDLGTNRTVPMQLAPARVGTNWLLTLRPAPEAPYLAAAIARNGVVLKNYSPMSAFTVAISLAIYGGIALASPVLFYVLLQYFIPALMPVEKKYVLHGLAIGLGLFLAGAAFCYFILLQMALYTTVEFSRWLSFGADEWRAEDYLGFIAQLLLAVGLAFELPVLLLTLVKIGALDYPKLVKWRAFAVIGNLVLAAILTPWGDPFTMCLIALPLQGLYEISVLIAGFWHRRDRRRARAPVG